MGQDVWASLVRGRTTPQPAASETTSMEALAHPFRGLGKGNGGGRLAQHRPVTVQDRPEAALPAVQEAARAQRARGAAWSSRRLDPMGSTRTIRSEPTGFPGSPVDVAGRGGPDHTELAGIRVPESNQAVPAAGRGDPGVVRDRHGVLPVGRRRAPDGRAPPWRPRAGVPSPPAEISLRPSPLKVS
jgi:hypothetical protein